MERYGARQTGRRAEVGQRRVGWDRAEQGERERRHREGRQPDCWLLIADCLAFVAERKCGLGRKAESHVCICICVSWVCVRVCVCVCARWRTGYELRQERQHGAPTRLDMCMPFFMAGVVACGNSAGLDLDASSCFGCGRGSGSDSRVSRQSLHTRGVINVAHTETHNPHASH
jgi:hypothetical protein